MVSDARPVVYGTYASIPIRKNKDKHSLFSFCHANVLIIGT